MLFKNTDEPVEIWNYFSCASKLPFCRDCTQSVESISSLALVAKGMKPVCVWVTWAVSPNSLPCASPFHSQIAWSFLQDGKGLHASWYSPLISSWPRVKSIHSRKKIKGVENTTYRGGSSRLNLMACHVSAGMIVHFLLLFTLSSKAAWNITAANTLPWDALYISSLHCVYSGGLYIFAKSLKACKTVQHFFFLTSKMVLPQKNITTSTAGFIILNQSDYLKPILIDYLKPIWSWLRLF